MNGIQEVSGSIPLISTNDKKDRELSVLCPFFVVWHDIQGFGHKNRLALFHMLYLQATVSFTHFFLYDIMYKTACQGGEIC